MERIEFIIPIHTISESNSFDHWRRKSSRHKQQQFFTKLAYLENVSTVHFPCTITLIRLSPGILDSDNLQQAMKYVRDEIAACMFPEKVKKVVCKLKKRSYINKGYADSDERVIWLYGQEKSKIRGIKVVIEYD